MPFVRKKTCEGGQNKPFSSKTNFVLKNPRQVEWSCENISHIALISDFSMSAVTVSNFLL